MALVTRLLIPITGSDYANTMKRRFGTVLGAVVDTTAAAAASDPIDIREFKDIAVKPSAGITTLAVYASDAVGGTYVLVDSIGTNGVVTVVASKWNVLDPTKIGPFGFIKFLPSGNGTVDVIGKT